MHLVFCYCVPCSPVRLTSILDGSIGLSQCSHRAVGAPYVLLECAL